MNLSKHSEYSQNNSTFTIANRFANFLLERGKKNNAYRLFLNSLIETDAKASNVSKPVPNLEKIGKQKMGYLKLISNSIRTQLQLPKANNEAAKKKSLFNTKKGLSTKEKCLQILENVKPNLETRRVRRGGTIYQVPSILSERRQKAIAIRWLIDAAEAKSKSNKKFITFAESLGEEFSATLKKSSSSRQKREQLHSLAAQNRGNMRYRWW